MKEKIEQLENNNKILVKYKDIQIYVKKENDILTFKPKVSLVLKIITFLILFIPTFSIVYFTINYQYNQVQNIQYTENEAINNIGAKIEIESDLKLYFWIIFLIAYGLTYLLTDLYMKYKHKMVLKSFKNEIGKN